MAEASAGSQGHGMGFADYKRGEVIKNCSKGDLTARTAILPLDHGLFIRQSRWHRSRICWNTEATMLRLKREQRQVLVDKVPDVANLVRGRWRSSRVESCGLRTPREVLMHLGEG